MGSSPGSEQSEGQLVAVTLGSLSPGEVGKPLSEGDLERAAVPQGWQMLGAKLDMAELQGVLSGFPRGYMADVLARSAAGGEQLGIAFAALRDAEVWRDIEETKELSARRSMAGRAVAEAAGLWAVSAGHAAVNVVARVVRLHPKSGSLDKKLTWTGPPTPFGEEVKANLSLNSDTVTKLAAAAKAINEPNLEAFVAPLRSLVDSTAWQALMLRRNVGYHRLRPQSISGGVPNANPWTPDTTTGSLTLTIYAGSQYQPPALETVVAETAAGYEALSNAMREIRDRMPAAFTAVGLKGLSFLQQ